MKYIILFTAKGCPPCEHELEELNKHNKLTSFNHKDDRFMIVNLQDTGHRIWAELLAPKMTPCSIFLNPGPDLHVDKIFEGVGCIDRTWKYLNYKTKWSKDNV